MNIFSAKYKAHKFVNIVFYLLVFVLGFFVGIGIKKLNISNLISNFLMIDNVNAYTLYSSDQLTVTEETIYNDILIANPNFDFDTYHNFVCATNTSSKSGFTFYSPNGTSYPNFTGFNGYKLDCYILTDTQKDAITSISYNSSSKTHTFSPSISGNFYEFYLILGTNSATGRGYFTLFTTNSSSLNVYGGSGSLGTNLHTNFNFNFNYSRYNNSLDFSQYLIPEMVYNDSLFDNDNNFKEVCVNNYQTFSITSNEYTNIEVNGETSRAYNSFDFIWFKNGVKGISTWLYDSEEETRVSLFDNDDGTYTDDPYGWWFWLNSADEIITYWNSPHSPGLELITKGYTDSNKYNYYNYTFYPFMMVFTTEYHRYQVFWFKNAYIEYLDGTIEYPEQYCFYIKNEYDVNILNKNAYGDAYSDITVLGGTTFNDKTYKNELSNDVNGLFSNVTRFISYMENTILFINSNIFNLYASMPFIVRLFILTFLTLTVIKIIIGMVVR